MCISYTPYPLQILNTIQLILLKSNRMKNKMFQEKERESLHHLIKVTDGFSYPTQLTCFLSEPAIFYWEEITSPQHPVVK